MTSSGASVEGVGGWGEVDFVAMLGEKSKVEGTQVHEKKIEG